MPSIKPSGAAAIIAALYIVAIFGTLHLLAISKPDNKFSRGWLGLGF